MNKKILNSTFIILTALAISFAFPMYNNADDTQTIMINQPICLNYKSKQEIYNIRKSYVARSIFADPNYEPSEEVFGGIEDNKPWISMNWCYTYNPNQPDNYVINTSGPSSHSRSLINPSLPALIEYPFGIPGLQEYLSFCSRISAAMVPLSATYSKSKKEVEITYRKLPNLGDDNSSYQITALNARDFGYNYIYIDKTRSTLKVQYLIADNASTGVKEITDFIHLGYSCRLKSGCNNWSRVREDLQFRITGSQLSTAMKQAGNKPAQENKPASTKVVRSVSLGNNKPTSSSQASAANSASNLPQLYIKLWKNKPSSPTAPADLNVKFVFKR